MTLGLTKRQADCLAFIDRFAAAHGYTPAYAEIGAALGISSRSSIHRLVAALALKGYITQTKHRERSIVVVRSAARPYDRTTLDTLQTDEVVALRDVLLDLVAERNRLAVIQHPTCPALERRA